VSDLIETRCACCQQPLGLLPRIAGLTAELDHYRDCLADDQVYGLAQKNRADLAEAEVTRLQAILDAPVVMLFADGREPTTNERHLANLLSWRQQEVTEAKVEAGLLRAELASVKAEVARLRTLIERDRTGLAAGLAEVRKIVGGYGWLAREDEWGSYEYHEQTEQTLRREMADCLDQVEAAALGALQESGRRVTEAFLPKAT